MCLADNDGTRDKNHKYTDQEGDAAMQTIFVLPHDACRHCASQSLASPGTCRPQKATNPDRGWLAPVVRPFSQALLAAGADPEVLDEDGRSPQDVASARKWSNVVSCLESHEARKVTSCPPPLELCDPQSLPAPAAS